MRVGVGVRNRQYLQVQNVYLKEILHEINIFLKEYTFEHDSIQHENLRIYVYNEEKFYEITVRSIGHFAYNQK